MYGNNMGYNNMGYGNNMGMNNMGMGNNGNQITN